MKIYSKIGDDGFTRSAGGQRMRKSAPRCEVLGSLDELSAQLGMCRQAARQNQPSEMGDALDHAQDALYAIGCMMAGAQAETSLPDSTVAQMEQRIDTISESLPALTNFVRSGGCELACRLHVARTVARRAERIVVAGIDSGLAVPDGVLRYLNRLGDLLFILARLADHTAGAGDERITS